MQRMVHEQTEQNLEESETGFREIEPWFRVLQRWRGEHYQSPEAVQRGELVAEHSTLLIAGDWT
jgi:hypothetical protein